MPILPTRARLAATGLAIATLTIVALAGLVLSDLDRETRLNHEVIQAQQVKDDLHTLRARLLELRAAARLGARTGDAQALRNIDRRAGEVEADLARLGRSSDALPFYASLSQSSRLLVMHGRSVASRRNSAGPASAASLAQEAERLAAEAIAALDHSLEAQTQNINQRTLAQIGVGERLRNYVAGLLIGSIVVLVGLFAGYRRLQERERETQRRIEHLAHFDVVTGLPNRALLSDRLAQETARARRASLGFAVLLFDLDGFKEVNDTWGHAAGDRVLTMVAERSRKCMRASDTVGRLGGDEFLAILPEAGVEGAVAVADKLREAIAQPYELGTATARLGASVGVSLFPDHGGDPESLQRAADAALYRAKREGKDRTIVAAQDPSRTGTASTRTAA